MTVFPYWEEVRDDQVKLLPLVPVTVGVDYNAAETPAEAAAMALMDSGAEHNVFPLAMAQDLNLDLSGDPDVTIVGVGGTHTPGKAVTVDFQIDRYRWTAPVIFSAAVNERPLLGQAGFFRFFTVTFRYDRRDIEVKQNRSPRVSTWRDHDVDSL